MFGKISGLRKRLARVERILIEFATRQEQVNFNSRCNCRESTIADPGKPEEFEAEMNRICPLHAFRRLGNIVEIEYIGQVTAKSVTLAQLLKTYRARQSPEDLRLSRLRQVGLKLKHGSKESGPAL